MITKFLPLPDDSGGRQRSLAIARRLAQHGELILCAYDDGSADHDGLRALGIDVRGVPWKVTAMNVGKGLLAARSVSSARFWSQGLVDVVRQAAKESPLDLVQVEYQQMVPIAAGVAAASRVLDLHNVESSLVESYARARRGPAAAFYRAESMALRHMEARTITDFDHVIVVSENEKARLPSFGGSVLVCPNGREPSDLLPEATAPTVAFVATMGWAPNVDAALWLGQEIWPLVMEKVPDARLLLVGRGPTPDVLALAGPSVDVTGTVSDVAPYLARSRVVVAPLRAGGGTRLKIMEALDSGRPVVATSVGCEGLEDLIGRGVVIANSTQDMADHIVRLLGDPGEAARLGGEGHDAVNAEHTWDIALRPLLQAVDR
jgi:glycosyltransferase involved in cell wall biosynthesis